MLISSGVCSARCQRTQVWIYLVAIVGGVVLGSIAPGIGPGFEALLWPVLAALLYTTFVQVPLRHAREARTKRAVWRERLGCWPVTLLALAVFLIAGAQVGTVLDAGPVLLTVLPVFVGFLLVAALLARALTADCSAHNWCCVRPHPISAARPSQAGR